jgi:hypothetical protein
MRTFIAAAAILPLVLAGQAAISKHGPETAVKAAYEADQPSIQGKGGGVMADASLRARFFSRSLLRAIDFDARADGGSAAAVVREPFSDQAPHLVDLGISPVSESGGTAKVLVEFARGDGARERLTYALVFERGDWRIDDIAYAYFSGEGHSLRGDLQAY